MAGSAARARCASNPLTMAAKNVKRERFPIPSDTAVSYQHASGGVEEILRPTLIVSGGRSYRKLTDIEFGRRPEDRAREREKLRRREEDRARVTEGIPQSQTEIEYSDEEECSQENSMVTHKSYTG